MTSAFPIIPCEAEHALPDGSVQLLGAVAGVTPTMTRVQTGGSRLLVDCGAPLRSRGWRLPREALEVDAVLLTHAHADHVSGLPTLLEAGYKNPIYATRATLDIAQILLADSIYLNGGRDKDIREFADRFRRLQRPVRYNESIRPVSSKEVTVKFHEAGHILGSASLELVSPASRAIISGDLGRPGSPILRDYNTTWNVERPVDLVLLETTYGDRVQEHASDDLERQLERAIKRALRDGGHILVPAFAIGRTQVLLYLLNNLVESGRIQNLPVAVDTPMGLRVTDTYARFKKLYDRESVDKIADGDDPLEFEDLYAVYRGRESRRLADIEQSMLIIAGSGMCTGGRIVGHLKELLPKPETNVVFVGHQAGGTPGRFIQEAAASGRASDGTTVRFDGEEIPLRAEVETLHGISAHADRDELAAWLGAIPNVKRVALHHGDELAQRAFAEWYPTRKEQDD